MKRLNLMTRICLLFIVFLISSCAANIEQTSQRHIDAAMEQKIVFQKVTDIELASGYARFIPKGSTWKRIGKIIEGDIYRPIDTVFTIEGKHDHEAYIVIDKAELQGFYLPVQQTFSPVHKKITLLFK